MVTNHKPNATITHCAMGWDGKPCCGYSDGTILVNKGADLILNDEYYKHDPLNDWAWPIDPKTGKKLPVKP